MLKKTITYTSLFTDKPVTEEHYFHISKADLVEMEMEEHRDTYRTSDGETLTGMQAKLQRIIDSQDGKAIIAELKDIMRRAYGKKDGDKFIKSREISNDFLASEAASELLFEICTNANTSAEFINGIIPGNLEHISAEIKREAAALEAQDGTKPPVNAIAAEAPTGLEGGSSVKEASITGDKADYEIRDEVKAATPENPVVLQTSDVVELPASQLQAGLADGRFKLS